MLRAARARDIGHVLINTNGKRIANDDAFLAELAPPRPVIYFQFDGFEARTDELIRECAFWAFPDKPAAAAEFARVLRPGGRVGLSDLTRDGALPPDLDGLLAWVAYIADAQPLAAYTLYLEDAGFSIGHVEPHDGALREMVGQIRTRLLGLGLMIKLGKIEASAIDIALATRLARGAASAVQVGTLGYALLVGVRPSRRQCKLSCRSSMPRWVMSSG